MAPLINRDTAALDEVLKVIAHLQTRNLLAVAEKEFFRKLKASDSMRRAVHSA